MSEFIHTPPFLEFLPWKNAGIRHGFTDISLNFRESAWESGWTGFTEVTGVSELLIDRQVHGNDVVDLRNPGLLDRLLTRDKAACFGRTGVEADAIIAPVSFGSKKIAIGVTIADCVPVLMKSEYGFAAIHAGWRGLVLGIVPKTLECLLGSKQNASIDVIVGPCAGSEDYEVGPEVIERLGSSARYASLPNGKALLNLVETLRASLTEARFKFSFHACGISTMSDVRFHSHRRDGEKAGRGIGFIVV